MVARGDLGMEIPIEKIFSAQKVMVYKCNIQDKPVVTTTQMLESMIKSPRPARAEATDVANPVLDGIDCVMLSGETAAGAYPEFAVATMAKICVEAESTIHYADVFKRITTNAPMPMSPLESLASSAVVIANASKVVLILLLTRGGSTAKLVAKYRPGMIILPVVVPEIKTDSFDLTKLVAPSDTCKKNIINCGIAFRHLKDAGVPLYDDDGIDIVGKDIVSGDKELTLSWLWNIFVHL